MAHASTAMETTTDVQVKGKPVSGRTWKLPRKRYEFVSELDKSHTNRNSASNVVLGPKITWEKRLERKRAKDELKAKIREMEEAQKLEKTQERERREAAKKRREENLKKSSKYQVVCLSF